MRWRWLAIVAVLGCTPTHRNGHATVVVRDEAREASCASGEWRACVRYAEAVETGSLDGHTRLRPDRARARELFTRACDAGSGAGCYGLARLLDRNSHGRNFARVEQLFMDACDLGEDAACKLGRTLPDAGRALALYRRSCERGERASCLLVGAPIPSGATATTEAAERACETGAAMLARGSTDIDVTREIPLARLAFAHSVRDQSSWAWTVAAAYVHDIARDELATTTHALTHCIAAFRDREAYLARLDSRLVAADATSRAHVAFETAVAPVAAAMWRLALVYNQLADHPIKPWSHVEDLLADLQPEDATRMLAQLAEVEAACTRLLPGAGAAFPPLSESSTVHPVLGVPLPADLAVDPDAWCYVARERVVLMRAALATKPFLDAAHRDALAASLATNPADELVMLATDPAGFELRYRDEARRWYDAIGEPLPNDPVPAVAKFAREIRQQIARLRPSTLADHPAAHDARIEQLARAAFTDATVLATGLQADGYTVVGDDAGAARQRWRAGTIVVHRGRLPWCEERSFSYVETFERGRYQPSSTVHVAPPSRTVACSARR